MEACEKLKEMGELTHNLLPRGREVVEFESNFLKELEAIKAKEEEMAPGKIGSTKRTRWYLKKCAFNVIGDPIVPDKPMRLFVITLKFFPFANSDFKSYAFEFDKHPYKFGLVVNFDLAEVPDFELKTSRGYVLVTLSKVRDGINLTPKLLTALQAFQRFLSEQAYSIPVYTMFSPEEVSKILVAPLNRDHNVDWVLIEKLLAYDSSALLDKLTEKEQRKFAFDRNAFLDALVVPWCDKSEQQDIDVYFVEEVVQDSSAFSCIPNSKITFQKHGETVLKRRVMHPRNPYLRCYKIGLERNFLLSTNNNKKDSQDVEVPVSKKKKWNRYFLPEFVHVSPIPASLLLQGKFIPSIIHRINRLLTGLSLKNAVGKLLDWNVEEDKHAFVRKELFVKQRLQSPSKVNLENGTSEAALGQNVKPPYAVIHTFDREYVHSKLEVITAASETKEKSQARKSNHVSDPVEDNDVTSGLIDVDDIRFPSFDAPVDFTKEKGPGSHVIMEALTLLGANDSINMEKLEVMGDATLKLIVSSHLYAHFPEWDEGQLTTYRTKFISNEHLFLVGCQREIGKVLSSCKFDPINSFLPPGFFISSRLQNLVVNYDTDYEVLKPLGTEELSSSAKLKDLLEKPRLGTQAPSTNTYTHSKISDKSVADAIEALIGAYYLHGGLESSFRIMYWLRMEGPCKDRNSLPYGKYFSFSSSSRNVLARNCNGENWINFLPGLDDLERLLGYSFNNKWLAVEALTHASFIHNRVTGSYERLEFIGDAVLDFLVTDYIVKQTGIRDPGQVTDLRSALVNNITFGTLALQYNFHKYLLHASDKLVELVNIFSEQHKTGEFVMDHDMFTILSDEEYETAEDVEIPKVFGDIFESLMGAIYIDSKFSLDAVWRRAYRLMKTQIDAFSKNVPIAPVRKLYEKYAQRIEIRDVENLNPMKSSLHLVEISIRGTGITVRGMGSTKKQAKQAAAKYILKKFP